MYILYVQKCHYVQYARFDSIAAAKAFYEELKLGADYVVTIESYKHLTNAIILQGA